MTASTLSRSAVTPIGPVNRRAISELSRVIESVPTTPLEPMLIGPDGEQVALPEEIYRVLTIAVAEMKAGHAVTITPLSQRISTQDAADLLGVSRPTFVKLLEAGELAYEQPGRHRRILLSDVLAYRETRHREALTALDAMTAEAVAAGLYDDDTADYADALRSVRRERGKTARD